MREEHCPECGDAFGTIWVVAVGADGGYTPVFGGPVQFDVAWCERCGYDFERFEAGPWRQREGGSAGPL